MSGYECERFEGRPELIRQARRFVSRTLVNAGVRGEVINDAVTCVSELATNAVEHTVSGLRSVAPVPEPSYEVRVLVEAAHVRVEVADQGAALPPPLADLRRVGPDAESGRGLHIVSQLGRIYAGDGEERPGRFVGVVLELPAGADAEGVR